MSISSIGVGSGLDVNSIVTQLVAIEKQPLQALATKATTFQTQLSTYGTINSQVAALETAASALATSSGWAIQKATSSDATVVSVTAGSAAQASVMSVDVTQLARAQSSASVGVAVGTTIATAGTLSIQLGSWAGSTFTGTGAVSAVAIEVGDSVANIASKINAQYAGLTEGVTATVLKDGTNERLVVTSKKTGQASGFHIGAAVGTDLSKYGFESNVNTPLTATSTGVLNGAAATAVAGTLSIRVGSWNDAAFAAGTSSAVSVAVAANDTVTQMADKINLAYGSTVASVDASGGEDRLVFSYTGQGDAPGFRIDTLDAGLSAYVLSAGSAAAETRTSISQSALNAKVNINGVNLTPDSNNMVDVSTGVSLKLNKIGTSEITIEQDKEGIQTKVQAFADAYSALSTTLASATKYVAGGKSGPLQGDSTTVGIQSLLRSALGSITGADTGPDAKRMTTVGLEQQKDGTLKLNATKFTAAMADMPGLQTLFTQANTGGTGITDNSGFALKFKTLTRNLLHANSSSSIHSNGTIVDKQAAINGSIKRNGQDQDRINERALRVEAALRRQYSALDVQMGKMSGLSSYVNAQLAQWNKTTG